MTIKNFSGYKITVFFRNNRIIHHPDRILPFYVLHQQWYIYVVLAFFGLDAEAVLDAEHEVAGEGVGVGDGASARRHGVADVGEFVQ